MIRLAADENFNGDVLDQLQKRNPQIDVVRVQDTPLRAAIDPDMLQWAAQEDRILLTHDVQTVTKYAYDRVRAGLPMPGIVEVNNGTPIGRIVEDLLLFVECSTAGEYANRILYIPLK